MMTRQEELTQQLVRYAEAYYDSDTPIISDAEYDALYDELVQLEQESGFVLPGSPTKRVGAEVQVRFYRIRTSAASTASTRFEPRTRLPTGRTAPSRPRREPPSNLRLNISLTGSPSA